MWCLNGSGSGDSQEIVPRKDVGRDGNCVFHSNDFKSKGVE